MVPLQHCQKYFYMTHVKYTMADSFNIVKLNAKTCTQGPVLGFYEVVLQHVNDMLMTC